MPLVFAAVAPHGDVAIEEACGPDRLHLGRDTRAAMSELGRRFEEASPDVTVVVTPHGVHVEGRFAVAVAAELRGGLGAFLPSSHERPELDLSAPSDADFARQVARALTDDGLPALTVSFGGNNPAEAVLPMDWGTLVPLWHLGARDDPPVPAVVVSPARDRPLAEHVAAGRAIASAARHSPKRVALVASADHGHAHDAEGPYGFDEAAADYDGRVVEAVRANRLGALLELEDLAGRAKADSLWQLVVLHGALGEDWRGELLAYEVPTYYGMVVAAYRQA